MRAATAGPTPARARIIPKAERSTPTGSKAGAADRLYEGGHHVATGGDDDHVDLWSRALLGRDAADDLMLEHGLVERHRNLLLRLEANGRLHLLRVLDRRQPQRADDHLLVADAEPHLLGELVRGEEGLERVGDAVRVGDLALVEGARREWLDRGADDLRGSVDPDLGRSDAAGLDLEADRCGRPSSSVFSENTHSLNRQKVRRPFALQVPISRRTWRLRTGRGTSR